MSCENDTSHNPDNYCNSCATCHDCVEEGEQSIQDELKGLKEALQNAINERNQAWFQLEENNIKLVSPLNSEKSNTWNPEKSKS